VTLRTPPFIRPTPTICIRATGTTRNETAPIQLAQCRFPGLAIFPCIGADFIFLGQRTNCPFPPPFPFSPLPPLPLEVDPLNTARGLGSAVSSPVGSGAKPQPTNDLMHIGVKGSTSVERRLWSAVYAARVIERRVGRAPSVER